MSKETHGKPPTIVWMAMGAVLLLYLASWPFVEMRFTSEIPIGRPIPLPIVGLNGQVIGESSVRCMAPVVPKWVEILYSAPNRLRLVNNRDNPVQRYWKWCGGW